MKIKFLHISFVRPIAIKIHLNCDITEYSLFFCPRNRPAITEKKSLTVDGCLVTFFLSVHIIAFFPIIKSSPRVRKKKSIYLKFRYSTQPQITKHTIIRVYQKKSLE